MDLYNAVKKYGSINAAARALDMPPTTFRRRLDKERKNSIRSFNLPEAITYNADSEVKHFILTSAQDKTKIHQDFWNNLIAYADYLDAEIIVGGFTYSKKLFTESDPTVRSDDVWFDEQIEPYIIHDRIALGDRVLFCAEMNTNPTATAPLSGLETYTKDKWGIFPHAKVHYRSIATIKSGPSKHILTTGTVTLPNYVRKKTGIKAEFHHMIAAVVVSIAPDGAFFCRHIHAADQKDGSFYDLDRFVSNKTITNGHRPEALVHGDIHIEKVDPVVALTTWGYNVNTRTIGTSNTLVSYLKPKKRIFHDLSDFERRNHHNILDHYHRLKMYFEGKESVADELKIAARFLALIYDQDIDDIVIQSNHDNALLRWVKSGLARNDPANYEFWLECELLCVRAIKAKAIGSDINLEEFFLYEAILHDFGAPANTEFRKEYDKFSIKDVELAIHGHYGANGGRGSSTTFVKIGPKSITGHTHTPSITDGHMCVGTNSLLEMGYNKGLSSWSHTNAILYPDGHRTLITLNNGRWFEV